MPIPPWITGILTVVFLIFNSGNVVENNGVLLCAIVMLSTLSQLPSGVLFELY